VAPKGQGFLGEKVDAIRAMSRVGGKPAGYVCDSFTCETPVTEGKAPGELRAK
jgi:uncharacterized protein YyaL (SSP411 family)